VTVALSN